MEATKHYLERASERFDIKEEAAIRMMLHCLERGKLFEEMQSRERSYMQSLRRATSVPMYYAGKIFIFSEEMDNCITAYEAPNWFGQKRYYTGKERIRDVKKYYRLYAQEMEMV